jgi:hypothetical protein
MLRETAATFQSFQLFHHCEPWILLILSYSVSAFADEISAIFTHQRSSAELQQCHSVSHLRLNLLLSADKIRGSVLDVPSSQVTTVTTLIR